MCDRALRRRSPEGIDLGKAAAAAAGKTAEAEGTEDPLYHEERKAVSLSHPPTRKPRTCLVRLDVRLAVMVVEVTRLRLGLSASRAADTGACTVDTCSSEACVRIAE